MTSQFEQISIALKQNPKTWLVTGVAGFIGSNLLEFLLLNNQYVIGLDNFSTGFRHNLDDVANIVGKERFSNFVFFEGDIANLDTCQQACENVDIILHQAALGSVPRSIEDPIASNHSNVTGFLNMLYAAKQHGIKRFVYASSSSVYGDSQELPKTEDRTGNLLSPYAVTKSVNELYANVFYKTYNLETVGLRYFNVFGKRQNPNGAYAAVIPKWIEALYNTKEAQIYGDGETSRDFSYIANIIQANILAATTNNNTAFGSVMNIAAGGRTTLNDLFLLIQKQMLQLGYIKQSIQPSYQPFRQGDIRHSNADISKANKLLGFMPTHSLEEGMIETLQWYGHYL